MDSWTWAHLNSEQLGMVEEAEQTLGENVKYLLAYQQNEGKGSSNPLENRAQVAKLNDSQVECLQGLEQKLHAVVIAYA